MLEQYGRYLVNMSSGNFDVSYRGGRKVGEIIAERAPVTLLLGMVAYALAVVLGVPAGVVAVLKRSTATDRIIMAVKFAHALGARVVLFSTSPAKLADAKALGADEAVLSTDDAQMAAQKYRFDFILDTVSARHPLDPYLRALTLDGTLCCLGIPAGMDFTPVLLTMGRRRLVSSGVAGTRETQEMLDFCSEHGIAADVEVIAANAVDEGFERLERGDVRYRLVIDMTTLEAPSGA